MIINLLIIYLHINYKQFTIIMIINRKKLLNAIQKGGKVAGVSKITPITQNVLITIKDGNIEVNSTDSRSYVSYKQEINTEDNMAICVAKSDIEKYLSTIQDDNIDISVNTNNLILKIGKKGKFSIPIVSNNDFPQHIEMQNTKSYKMKSNILLDAILRGKNYLPQNDEFRPVNCLYVLIDNNNITTCASNAHKLLKSTYVNEMENTIDGNIDFLLDKCVFPLLLDFLKEYEDVTISINDKHIRFDFVSCSIQTTFIEGKYPNFESVIPKNNSYCVEVNTDEFKEAIKLVSLSSNIATGLICLKFNNNDITIISNDLDTQKAGEQHLNTKCDFDLEIGFRAEYLLDVVSSFNGDTIKLNLSKPSQPLVVNSNNYIALLMPMNINK